MVIEVIMERHDSHCVGWVVVMLKTVSHGGIDGKSESR